MDEKTARESRSGEVVNGFRSCRDLSDVVLLYAPRGLYLKPIAKINVSVNLPQLKIPGKTISTWEVMEKIRVLARPDQFSSLKVTKSTLEFVRLEGDLEDRCRLQQVLARLDSQRLNLAGFPNILKVRAAEAKDEFPTRHSWDSYFRDAKHMNELKPGERPDTIHITGLPVKWFCEEGAEIPSESLVSKIFRKWGPLRRVDVPAADPYRSRMRLGTNIQKFSFGDGLFFDAYIQYVEYMDFVNAMDALRGMKLLKKEPLKYLTATIKADFDKTKHMNDSSVAHREFERKRLTAQDSMAAEKLRKKQEAIESRKAEQRKQEEANSTAKQLRRQKREEKRKRKALTIIRKQEEDKVSMKIAREERKLIKAQRQLESIRLLDELFDRLKVKVEQKEIEIKKTDTESKKDVKKSEKLGQEKTSEHSESDEDKKKDRKNKKSKKRKIKKDKKKKKKQKKDKKSATDEDADYSDDGARKVKSVLTSGIALPSSSSGPLPVDTAGSYPVMYPSFDPAWYWNGAASPLFFPPMMRGIPRGPPRGRFLRGRGRGFTPWRGHFRQPRPFNPHVYNDQYYKYFAKLTGHDYHDLDLESDWDRDSRSRSQSRRRSRTRSYSRSRSRSRRRSRSRSRNRSRSRSRTRSRSRSKSRTRSRSRGRARSRSRSKSRSRSGRRGGARTRSGSRRSRSHSRTRSRSRSRKLNRSRSNSRTNSSRRKRRRRSGSRVMITRAKSRSVSPKHKSRSSSWSLPRTPNRRSCSWSKDIDSQPKGGGGKKKKEGERDKRKKSSTETRKKDDHRNETDRDKKVNAENGTIEKVDNVNITNAAVLQTEAITPD
ncbi:uncharacterized protein DDB_G0284459-like isoform X2 [Diprion similis]|uniref:uncharacterized protein DDB_G0284459-like isoform X2 n=1 Tax=Diprion similis TaxID=362088 RepID=UPI001EF92A93|nr:uncharacterized protein DDB_G0284459-like isoform X2 [Diprion similis]